MPRTLLYTLAGLLLSGNALAVNIQFGDLPAEIQACQLAGDCAVSLSSFFDVPNSSGSTAYGGSLNPNAMSAFNMVDVSSGAQEFLFRYNLVEPSVAQLYDTVQFLSGSVWLRMGVQYDTNMGTPQASLYFDKVNPLPGNLFPGDSDGLSIDVALSSTALLGGSGGESVGCCDDPGYSGTMALFGDSGFPALLPCVADGCYSTARLNLLYLAFVDPDADGIFGLIVDPSDERGRLLTVSSFDPYGGLEGTGELSSISYHVATVPVPPALYLLVSGLGLLGGLGRKYKVGTGI